MYSAAISAAFVPATRGPITSASWMICASVRAASGPLVSSSGDAIGAAVSVAEALVGSLGLLSGLGDRDGVPAGSLELQATNRNKRMVREINVPKRVGSSDAAGSRDSGLSTPEHPPHAGQRASAIVFILDLPAPPARLRSVRLRLSESVWPTHQ